MANNHDIPESMPVPEQLHVFDVYRMQVRFEDDPTKSRNHYVAAIVIQADDDGGVAVKLTSNPTWHGAGDVQLPEYEQCRAYPSDDRSLRAAGAVPPVGSTGIHR